MNNSNKNHGFTLIEIMIVIAIIGILTVTAYIPYNYYGQLARVRLSVEIVDQSVNEAKILASNGYTFPGTNSSANIGLVFKKSSNTLDMFAYQSGSLSLTSAKLIKSIALENDITVSGVPSSSAVLVYFIAPTGNIKFYRENGMEITDSGALITVGWKGATTGALSKETTILKNY